MKLTKTKLKKIILESLDELAQEPDAKMDPQGMASVQMALKRAAARLLEDAQFKRHIERIKGDERQEAQFMAQLQAHLFGKTGQDLARSAVKQRQVGKQMGLGAE